MLIEERRSRRRSIEMRVTRYVEGRQFLERAGLFLRSAEAEHGLLLGLGDRTFDDASYLATVEDRSTVVACAARTPPLGLVISRVADPVAIAALVEDLADKYGALPSVFGSEPTVTTFARMWSDRFGIGHRRFMTMRLFEARGALQPFALPPGRLRPAAPSDLPILVPWVTAFHNEAKTGLSIRPEEVVRGDLAMGRLFVWEDGEVVSLAKGLRRTERAAHISLVFTPPAHRRRGYASALVAGLTRRLLNGAVFCCISADAGNAVTNRIYPALGYQLVGETATIEFGNA